MDKVTTKKQYGGTSSIVYKMLIHEFSAVPLSHAKVCLDWNLYFVLLQLGVRVCVSHLPLFHCEVCPGLFATPPHSALFPLLPSDVETIQARLINEVN